jgi:uncharacterized ion transporter superfamily protein YfcC
MTLSDGIIFRVMVYLVFLSTAIVFTTLYARKVKLHPKSSLVYEFDALHKSTFKFDDKIVPPLTTKRKITLIIFASAFVLMIAGAIP